MSNYHTSVLLEEAISALNVKSGDAYIDATFGGGGHSKAILDREGVVLAIDADQDAIEASFKDPNLTLVRGNFKDIDQIAKENGYKQVSGIIFDLGISSHQIEIAERGFSYLKPGPLDMRMDQRLGVKAKDLVNALGVNELHVLFNNLGEERRARAISEAIVTERKQKPIETTLELSDLLARVYGFREASAFARSESGKRVFQALRMQVNSEIDNLEQALPKAIGLLRKGGRLAVISFHSLEDRRVKEAFREAEARGIGKIITKKPILPTKEEMTMNSRSKGAKLRIIEKI